MGRFLAPEKVPTGICPKCGSLDDYLLPDLMCYGCAFVEDLRSHLREDWSRYGRMKQEYAELARQLEQTRLNLRHDEATLRKALEKREVRREETRRRRGR